MEFLYFILSLSLAYAFVANAPSDCPKGWTRHDNSCYYASPDTTPERKNWTDAMAICKRDGGYLAEIKDMAENTFVLNLLQEVSGGVYAFLGGNDRNIEGKWEWANSMKALQFNNFYPGEANINGGGEDCLVIETDSKWFDVPCLITANYVCEKSANQ